MSEPHDPSATADGPTTGGGGGGGGRAVDASPPSPGPGPGAPAGSGDPGIAGHPAEASRPRPAAGAWLLPRHAVPPPPRPGERHVQLPRLGVILSDDELRRRVDAWFHKPMIVLAVLVLPLLGVEFLLLGRHPELQQGILGILIPLALAVIWLAFFVEFVVKITIAESRIEYVRRHWIDLAIIVMPLLRPLRIARVARTAKVFTLRGVGMKMARYGFALFLGVEAGERLAERFGLRRTGLRDPSEMTRHQLEQEVKRLRGTVEAWEQWHAAHRAHRERFGIDRHFEAREAPGAPGPRAGTPEPEGEPRPGADGGDPAGRSASAGMPASPREDDRRPRPPAADAPPRGPRPSATSAREPETGPPAAPRSAAAPPAPAAPGRRSGAPDGT